jgi:hypothetical protein
LQAKDTYFDQKAFEILAGEIPIPEALRRL